jgi:hypothetical protein
MTEPEAGAAGVALDRAAVDERSAPDANAVASGKGEPGRRLPSLAPSLPRRQTGPGRLLC